MYHYPYTPAFEVTVTPGWLPIYCSRRFLQDYHVLRPRPFPSSPDDDRCHREQHRCCGSSCDFSVVLRTTGWTAGHLRPPLLLWLRMPPPQQEAERPKPTWPPTMRQIVALVSHKGRMREGGVRFCLCGLVLVGGWTQLINLFEALN